jgi:hypothetical protein
MPDALRPMLADRENGPLVHVPMVIEDRNGQGRNRVQEAIGSRMVVEGKVRDLVGHGRDTTAAAELGPLVWDLGGSPPFPEAIGLTETGPVTTERRDLLIVLLTGGQAMIEVIEVIGVCARKSPGDAADVLMGPNVLLVLPAPAGPNVRRRGIWGAVIETEEVLEILLHRKLGRKCEVNARNVPGPARNSTVASEAIAPATVKVVPGVGPTVQNARIDRIAVLHGSDPQSIRPELLVTIVRTVFARPQHRSRSVTGRSKRKSGAHVSELRINRRPGQQHHAKSVRGNHSDGQRKPPRSKSRRESPTRWTPMLPSVSEIDQRNFPIRLQLRSIRRWEHVVVLG